MILVSVMYPAGPRFDMEYYLDKHMALVRERWTPLGLREATVVAGTGTPDGGPAPFQVMAFLKFDAPEAFKAAAKAHGPEIFGDIPNFTDARAQVQISAIAQ